jgi:uncharacterized protein YqeY
LTIKILNVRIIKMSDLREKIKNDFKEAFKAKEISRLSVLKMLNAAIANAEIAKNRQELSEEELIGVILSEAKKRKDAIEQYEKAGRENLAGKEKEELEILKNYLPEQLPEEKIKELVQKIIQEIGADSLADFGKVMGKTAPQLKGKADGAIIAKIVKEELEK